MPRPPGGVPASFEDKAKGIGCLLIVALVVGGLLWTWAFGKPKSDHDREREAKSACAAYITTYLGGDMSWSQVGSMAATEVGGGYRVVGRANSDGSAQRWTCITREGADGRQVPEGAWS